MNAPGGNGERILLAITAAAALGLGAYLLFFASGRDLSPEAPPPASPADDTPVPATTPPPDAETTRDTQPSPPAVPSQIPTAAAQPELPPLTESDAEIRSALRSLLGDGALREWLDEDQLAQRITSQVNGLQKGVFVPETLLLAPPPGEFQVERRAGGIYPSTDNYRRYDTLVALILGIDVAATAEIFHRYRPLLEQAYGQLGLPPEQFDAAVLEAIDHLLATPEPGPAPELVAESVAYRYADPQLEALGSARKQLLRTGPAHVSALKAWLRELREALTTHPSGAD